MPLPTARMSSTLNLRAYFLLSFLLTLTVVCSHYIRYQDFYLMLLSIISSHFSVLTFVNLFLVLSVLFGYVVKSFFLGTLRDTEVEFLYEKVSPTLFDAVLSFSLFRTPFDVSCILMLVMLFFFKCFHWLIQKRVDFVGQIAVPSCISYIRLMALIVLFFSLDLVMIRLSIQQEATLAIFLLYKFEFSLLALSIYLFSNKYMLILYDIYCCRGQWEEKNTFVMLLELVGDFCRMILNIFLFVSMINNIGLPLHLTRQFAESIILFRRRLVEFVRYRRATKNMNQRFPTATPDQIAHANHICVICREVMTQGKTLPCGHILHLRCLREWLEHQQNCPTCRLPVLETDREPRHVPPPPQPPSSVPNGQTSPLTTEQPPPHPTPSFSAPIASYVTHAPHTTAPHRAPTTMHRPVGDDLNLLRVNSQRAPPFTFSWGMTSPLEASDQASAADQHVQYMSVPFVQVPPTPQTPQGIAFLTRPAPPSSDSPSPSVESPTLSHIETLLLSIQQKLDYLEGQIQELRRSVSPH